MCALTQLTHMTSVAAAFTCLKCGQVLPVVSTSSKKGDARIHRCDACGRSSYFYHDGRTAYYPRDGDETPVGYKRPTPVATPNTAPTVNAGVCYSCKQPGHYSSTCPAKVRRVSSAPDYDTRFTAIEESIAELRSQVVALRAREGYAPVTAPSSDPLGDAVRRSPFTPSAPVPGSGWGGM